MVAREEEERRRTPRRPSGMILFAIVHDGDNIPKALQPVQRIEIQKGFNSRMRHDSILAEELSATLAASATGIARTIQEAPAFRQKWTTRGAKQFFDRFHVSDKAYQSRLTTFTGAHG